MLKVKAVVRQVLHSLMLLSLLSIPLSVHSEGLIKVISYSDYPPYLYLEDGEQVGLYMRIVDVTLKAIEQPYSLETLPFKRGIYKAAAGDGVVIGILKTDERMKTLDFSEPFYHERISVFFNKPQVPLMSNVHGLDGLVVGKLLGWSYGSEFDRAKESKRFITQNNELETNFIMLAKGRLNAVIHSELSSAYILNKLRLKNEVFLGSEPLALGGIRLAVKKGTHGDLIRRINEKLKQASHKKKIAQLVKSYKEGL